LPENSALREFYALYEEVASDVPGSLDVFCYLNGDGVISSFALSLFVHQFETGVQQMFRLLFGEYCVESLSAWVDLFVAGGSGSIPASVSATGHPMDANILNLIKHLPFESLGSNWWRRLFCCADATVSICGGAVISQPSKLQQNASRGQRANIDAVKLQPCYEVLTNLFGRNPPVLTNLKLWPASLAPHNLVDACLATILASNEAILNNTKNWKISEGFSTFRDMLNVGKDVAASKNLDGITRLLENARYFTAKCLPTANSACANKIPQTNEVRSRTQTDELPSRNSIIMSFSSKVGDVERIITSCSFNCSKTSNGQIILTVMCTVLIPESFARKVDKKSIHLKIIKSVEQFFLFNDLSERGSDQFTSLNDVFAKNPAQAVTTLLLSLLANCKRRNETDLPVSALRAALSVIESSNSSSSSNVSSSEEEEEEEEKSSDSQILKIIAPVSSMLPV
jgi:hypothetical protein